MWSENDANSISSLIDKYMTPIIGDKLIINLKTKDEAFSSIIFDNYCLILAKYSVFIVLSINLMLMALTRTVKLIHFVFYLIDKALPSVV